MKLKNLLFISLFFLAIVVSMVIYSVVEITKEEVPEADLYMETQGGSFVVPEGTVMWGQAEKVKVECDYCGGYEIEVNPMIHHVSGIHIDILAECLPKDFPKKTLTACPRCLILAYDKLFKDLNK